MSKIKLSLFNQKNIDQKKIHKILMNEKNMINYKKHCIKAKKMAPKSI